MAHDAFKSEEILLPFHRRKLRVRLPTNKNEQNIPRAFNKQKSLTVESYRVIVFFSTLFRLPKTTFRFKVVQIKYEV